MSDRITTVLFKDLTLEHLFLTVEVNCRAGQLVGWELDEVLLGPQAEMRHVPVGPDTEILVLDAPTHNPVSEFAHFGLPHRIKS